jgi:hypothetical protein
MAQVLQSVSSKSKALNSIPSTTKKCPNFIKIIPITTLYWDREYFSCKRLFTFLATGNFKEIWPHLILTSLIMLTIIYNYYIYSYIYIIYITIMLNYYATLFHNSHNHCTNLQFKCTLPTSSPSFFPWFLPLFLPPYIKYLYNSYSTLKIYKVNKCLSDHNDFTVELKHF